jgi:hypothetical protein
MFSIAIPFAGLGVPQEQPERDNGGLGRQDVEDASQGCRLPIVTVSVLASNSPKNMVLF